MAILNQTQEERVLNWIKSNGEIMGYTIKTEWREGKNRFGEKVRFCAYSLG